MTDYEFAKWLFLYFKDGKKSYCQDCRYYSMRGEGEHCRFWENGNPDPERCLAGLYETAQFSGMFALPVFGRSNYVHFSVGEKVRYKDGTSFVYSNCGEQPCYDGIITEINHDGTVVTVNAVGTASRVVGVPVDLLFKPTCKKENPQ